MSDDTPTINEGDHFLSGGGKKVHVCSTWMRFGGAGPFTIGSPCGVYDSDGWATKVDGPSTCKKCIKAESEATT